MRHLEDPRQDKGSNMTKSKELGLSLTTNQFEMVNIMIYINAKK
jgi:hypothetical protein